MAHVARPPGTTLALRDLTNPAKIPVHKHQSETHLGEQFRGERPVCGDALTCSARPKAASVSPHKYPVPANAAALPVSGRSVCAEELDQPEGETKAEGNGNSGDRAGVLDPLRDHVDRHIGEDAAAGKREH